MIPFLPSRDTAFALRIAGLVASAVAALLAPRWLLGPLGPLDALTSVFRLHWPTASAMSFQPVAIDT